MNQFQNKFLAFIESACSKIGHTDIIGPLQEGFRAICEAEEQTKSFDIPGVKVLSQTRDSNFGRYVSDAGLGSVQYVSEPDGHYIVPKKSNPNFAEYFYLTVEAPDGEKLSSVYFVGDEPIPDFYGTNLSGITQNDGFVFIQVGGRSMYVYKDNVKIAYIREDNTVFFTPQDNGGGKVYWNQYDDHFPPIQNKYLTANKLREVAKALFAEYDRIVNKKPVQNKVDRYAIRRAVGNFFYNKFEDVVDYCERNGYSTDATIMKVKRAVNDDYYTDDPGAVGGQTLEFPEAGLSEER